MEAGYSIEVIKSIGANKKLGQNFLVDRNVALAEAAHCSGKRVIEIGPGVGMLTEELCNAAKHVTSVELDNRLYEFLEANLRRENLDIINGDFFKLPQSKTKNAEMMASNVPYNLSSKTLMWLVERHMPAILCLQKEFVDRMLARPGTSEYSKLSLFCTLSFDAIRLMKVPAACFYPRPRVDSSLVYLKPTGRKISGKEMQMLALLMEHKNKKVRNAVEDSSRALHVDKHEARRICDGMEEKDSRVSKMDPKALLKVARYLSQKIRSRT